jgi:hypothetical protein
MMNNDPYTPPAAELEDETSTAPDFYIASPTKFTILYFATLGLYSIYWFYAHWASYRRSSGHRVWPIARAIFNIFFTHSLFKKIQTKLTEQKFAFGWNPGSLATAYVFLTIVSHILDKLGTKGIGTPYTDTIPFLLMPVIYFTLLIPQKAANTASGDPNGETNGTFTWANYVWIIIGVLLWLIVVLSYGVAFGIFNLPLQN